MTDGLETDLDLENLNAQTIHPSERKQSIRAVLRSLSFSEDPSKRTNNVHESGNFLEDLALKRRDSRQERPASSRRVFSEMADGMALVLMALQVFFLMVAVAYTAQFYSQSFERTWTNFWILAKLGPLFLFISLFTAFASSIPLYYFPRATIHAVSVSVLGFFVYNTLSHFPSFLSGNFASLLTLLFLALYYFRGLKHLELTCRFIQSASRICWRNYLSLAFVFGSYAFCIYSYLLIWSCGVVLIQSSSLPEYPKLALLFYSFISVLLCTAFLRDLLQIWLSRVIYSSTFAYSERPVIVTSTIKRSQTDNSSTSPNSSYEETRRFVSKDSMWWCLGTASRSAFHLVLRAFQIHIWILALIQIFFPKFGPPADPKCVVDIFHVPTAIYGTSYTKSRRYVTDTMVDHGMDKISVDLYLRTFIYYMISYACGILSLIIIARLTRLLGYPADSFQFKISFLLDCTWSLFTTSLPVHFACIFVGCGVVLLFTAVDSVHMILCWSICEIPTSVSALETELMHTLVSTYHARLDLRRFSGDRIRISV